MKRAGGKHAGASLFFCYRRFIDRARDALTEQVPRRLHGATA